jgi:hypothetical protein
LRALLFSLLICISSVSKATDYRVFVGVGPLLVPQSYRVGINEWDIGLLSATSFGIAKNYYLGGLPYMTFGVAAVADSVGFYGAIGLVGDLFWQLRWRTELQSAMSVTGAARGNGLIGLELKF